MRSSRILNAIQSAVKPVSDYLAPIAASTLSALSTVSPFNANEPGNNSDRVEMKPTKQADDVNSSAKILNRMKQCAQTDKKQPEIFIALLQKQELTADQVADFANEFAKKGKGRELDALAGKYNLPQEFVVDTLRKADKPETYQDLLEVKDEIKHIGYLFDPNNTVTIVEASDAATIKAATMATRKDTTKRIITVDTTEEYAPHHQEKIVLPLENTPPALETTRFFKPSASVSAANRASLYNRTNLIPEISYGSAFRNHN